MHCIIPAFSQFSLRTEISCVRTGKISLVAIDSSQFLWNSAYCRARPEITLVSDYSQIPCLVLLDNEPEPALSPHCIVLKAPLWCWMHRCYNKSRVLWGSAKNPTQIPWAQPCQMLHEHFQLWLSTSALQDKRYLIDYTFWSLKSCSKIYKKQTPFGYKSIQKYKYQQIQENWVISDIAEANTVPCWKNTAKTCYFCIFHLRLLQTHSYHRLLDWQETASKAWAIH